MASREERLAVRPRGERHIDDPSPGASDRQTVSLDYPDYADDPIWQAQLKDADTTLPPGMGLAPGGGVGLQECSYEQFGVSTTRPPSSSTTTRRSARRARTSATSRSTPRCCRTRIGGKAFFGPTGDSRPARPTATRGSSSCSWRARACGIKLVGDVTLSPSGQVRTVFLNNPETPFTHFRLKMGTEERAVLMTPLACGPQEGNAPALGLQRRTEDERVTVTPIRSRHSRAAATRTRRSSSTSTTPRPIPEQAGAHSVSRIVVSRPDDNDMLTGLDALAAAGCGRAASRRWRSARSAQAQAGDCPASTLVGNIKTTLGSGISLFTVPGKLYLAEPAQPGDVASIVATVPAKAGVPDADGQVPDRPRARRGDRQPAAAA